MFSNHPAEKLHFKQAVKETDIFVISANKL